MFSKISCWSIFDAHVETVGLQPYLPASVPCNDAGIAVGQMAVTAAWIEQSMNHNDKRHARVVVGL